MISSLLCTVLPQGASEIDQINKFDDFLDLTQFFHIWPDSVAPKASPLSVREAPSACIQEDLWQRIQSFKIVAKTSDDNQLSYFYVFNPFLKLNRADLTMTLFDDSYLGHRVFRHTFSNWIYLFVKIHMNISDILQFVDFSSSTHA